MLPVQPAPIPSTAFVHPIMLAVALLLALWVLNTGLSMRRLRRRRVKPPPGTRQRHLRIGQPTAVLLGLGMLSGPASAVWLRGWRALETVHGWLGLCAGACFIANALIGLRLKKQRSTHQALHGALGMIGVMLGLVATLSGIELLP